MDSIRKQKDNLLTIKEFAVLCRATPRTIRFYGQNRLLRPAYVDHQTKYRYYSPYQTREFFKIRLLQNFSIPLKQIPNILPQTTRETFLAKQLQKIEQEITEKHKEYLFLQKIKSFLFSEKSATEYLKPEVFGPYILFCMYVPKGQYDRINTHIIHLIKLAKELKIPITNKQMVFYLDPVTYQPKDTRLEICLVTKYKKITNIILPQDYYFKEYPKTQVKAYTYQGPFEYITLIYQKLYEENLRGQTIDPSKIGFDMHLAGPWNKKSPYDYLTKIAFTI